MGGTGLRAVKVCLNGQSPDGMGRFIDFVPPGITQLFHRDDVSMRYRSRGSVSRSGIPTDHAFVDHESPVPRDSRNQLPERGLRLGRFRFG